MAADPIWNDWKPRAWVPDESLMFFGANCIHTRALENAPRHDCPRCGGVHYDDRGIPHPNRGDADPVRDYEACVTERGTALLSPATAVCGVCGRSVYDGTAALSRAVKQDDGQVRPGYDLEEQAGLDKRDEHDRTGEAVSGKARSKGRIIYEKSSEYADHIKRLRARRSAAGRRG